LVFDLKFCAQPRLGFWGHESKSAIRRATQTANWVVDVGAGKGELCLFAAKVKSVRRIIAIEPDQEMVKSLQAKIERDDNLYSYILSGRIEIVEKIIGSRNCDKYIRLDQLHLDPSLHGFIKIEVDGSELEALRSGKQILSHVNVDVLIGTHSPELEVNCVSFLEDIGYKCRIIETAWWRSLVPERQLRRHHRWLFATPQS
jgi:SAM-dependent methyltransferase